VQYLLKYVMLANLLVAVRRVRARGLNGLDADGGTLSR
jgi:hypothetical protein